MYWCVVVVFGLYLCLAKYLHLSDNHGAAVSGGFRNDAKGSFKKPKMVSALLLWLFWGGADNEGMRETGLGVAVVLAHISTRFHLTMLCCPKRSYHHYPDVQITHRDSAGTGENILRKARCHIPKTYLFWKWRCANMLGQTQKRIPGANKNGQS